MTAALRKPKRPPPAAEWERWRDHAERVADILADEGYSGELPWRGRQTWRDYAISLEVMLMTHRIDNEPGMAEFRLCSETGPS